VCVQGAASRIGAQRGAAKEPKAGNQFGKREEHASFCFETKIAKYRWRSRRASRDSVINKLPKIEKTKAGEQLLKYLKSTSTETHRSALELVLEQHAALFDDILGRRRVCSAGIGVAQEFMGRIGIMLQDGVILNAVPFCI